MQPRWSDDVPTLPGNLLHPESRFQNFLRHWIKKDKYFFLKLFAVVAVTGLVVLDRISWASVSQWREDQAASIWIGAVQPILRMPVGLINSQGIPNPNGMFLLSFLISRLPGLWAISSFLGILQALMLLWLCWSWFGKTKLFLVSTAVLLSSAVLRAISIEFWNQWILLYLNILFFILLSRYNQRPNFTHFPLLLGVTICAPSLYLGGLANAITFFILFSILFLTTRSRFDRRRWLPALLISLFVVGFFLAVTWIPYLQAIKTSQLTSFMQASPGQLFRQIGIACITFFGFIGWSITWVLRLIPSVMFFSGNMLPASAGVLVYLHNFILEYLTFISFIALGFAALSSYKKNKNFKEVFLPKYQQQGKFILFTYAFILLSFTLTPLLKGPFWIDGERMDMTLQFLPFFLLIWFVTPIVVQLPSGFQTLVGRVSVVFSVVFVVVNLALGWMTVESLRNYRGAALTPSDVPLSQKLDVVQYVAQDWSSRSDSKEISIYYDFDAALSPEQKEVYGVELTPWYAAPYTLGRAMDYELLRRYHLHNSQEGLLTSKRKKDQAVYIVHYAFLPTSYPPGCYQEHVMGRLSVAVLLPGKPGCANR
jgi:hypothetical protein